MLIVGIGRSRTGQFFLVETLRSLKTPQIFRRFVAQANKENNESPTAYVLWKSHKVPDQLNNLNLTVSLTLTRP